MVPSYLPIKLSGDNLGKRHHELNDLVNDAFTRNIPFASIEHLQEQSPIDRLFKIDLAAKYRIVDYIIKNLKDDDMLYVSRALKSRWILNSEYSNIINPKYLEEILYPDMISTAVNKIRHWIHNNLEDKSRSETFYLFYIEKDQELALRFLWNCSKEFIVANFKNVCTKINPHQLKIFTEKCPEVAKVYYNDLETDADLVKLYMGKQKEYFESLKPLLKLNANIYLDIVEKYFDIYYFRKLSAEATRFIIENHKVRFMNKPTLYTAKLLDIKTLAKCLNEEEIKSLIVELAKAKYLSDWFEYKNVEPLIKAIKSDERAAFKKKIFVDKDVGEIVKDWPFKIPGPPKMIEKGTTIFDDKEDYPLDYIFMDCEPPGGSCRMMAQCAMVNTSPRLRKANYTQVHPTRKTSLDDLFDKYRFDGFDKTFSELRPRLAMADSQHRQYILLVLISKTAGRLENLEQFFKLLLRYKNEPDNVRATVVRSLVRRSNVWRVPQTSWELLMTFGHDLGLDGKPSTVACKEGVHAVILRNILHDLPIDSLIWNAYVKDFSNLKEYDLNKDEKETVKTKLPGLLLSAAESFLNSQEKTDLSKAIENLNLLIDVSKTYKIKFEEPRFTEAVTKAVRRDKDAEQLLKLLFESKINRKGMFKYNFGIIQNDASYLNALKHDTEILKSVKEFEILAEKGTLKHDKFLMKLSLYFNDENGLAEKYLSILEKGAEKSAKPQYGRPIAILAGRKILPIIRKLDEKENGKKLAVVLRANAHMARPLIDLQSIDLQWLGVKGIVNRKLNTEKANIPEAVEKLLSWNRTAKIAVLLSMKIGNEVDVLRVFAERRPISTIKVVLKHHRHAKMDEKVWDVILPLIPRCVSKLKPKLRNALVQVNVPEDKKAEYFAVLYAAFKKDFVYPARGAFCNLVKFMPEVDDDTMEGILLNFLAEDFTVDNLKNDNYELKQCMQLYVKAIARFLIQSKNEEQIRNRMEELGEPLLFKIGEFKKIRESLPKKEDNTNTEETHEDIYLNAFIRALKWNHFFLKAENLLCLRVIEKIIETMQKIWPIVLHFEKYVKLHLTMLYFKSIRQATKNNPGIFGNLDKKANEAADIVGVILGKYVAREITELRAKYFDSIKHAYKECLHQYLKNNFLYDENWIIFTASVIKGILTDENANSHLLAEHLFEREYHNSLPKETRKELCELLKQSNDQEVAFFFYSHV